MDCKKKCCCGILQKFMRASFYNFFENILQCQTIHKNNLSRLGPQRKEKKIGKQNFYITFL